MTQSLTSDAAFRLSLHYPTIYYDMRRFLVKLTDYYTKTILEGGSLPALSAASLLRYTCAENRSSHVT